MELNTLPRHSQKLVQTFWNIRKCLDHIAKLGGDTPEKWASERTLKRWSLSSLKWLRWWPGSRRARRIRGRRSKARGRWSWQRWADRNSSLLLRSDLSPMPRCYLHHLTSYFESLLTHRKGGSALGEVLTSKWSRSVVLEDLCGAEQSNRTQH